MGRNKGKEGGRKELEVEGKGEKVNRKGERKWRQRKGRKEGDEVIKGRGKGGKDWR